MVKEKILPHAIYAEMTPNPNTMKFVSNRWLVKSDKSYEILASQRIGSSSPLAEKLFQFPFINGVFLSGNFVTLTKSEAIEWQDVVIELREFIQSYLNKNGVVVNENIDKNVQKDEDKENSVVEIKHKDIKTNNYSDFEYKIIQALDEFIRPAVENDGGAIDFDSYKEGVVRVILKGSCSGCPSSTFTLKAGIESLLKNMFPEINEVVAING